MTAVDPTAESRFKLVTIASAGVMTGRSSFTSITFTVTVVEALFCIDPLTSPTGMTSVASTVRMYWV